MKYHVSGTSDDMLPVEELIKGKRMMPGRLYALLFFLCDYACVRHAEMKKAHWQRLEEVRMEMQYDVLQDPTKRVVAVRWVKRLAKKLACKK